MLQRSTLHEALICFTEQHQNELKMKRCSAPLLCERAIIVNFFRKWSAVVFLTFGDNYSPKAYLGCGNLL